MKMKKLLAVLSSTALCAAMLGSCGNSDSSSKGGADAAESKAEAVSAAEGESKAAEESKAEGNTEESKDEGGEAKPAGELIKVGIINNDPNESGYRTANDKDLRATFS